MSQPRFWIAAVVVAAAVTPSPVRADHKNEIRAVTFDEDAGTTRVHVQGAQTPTFTVYKLERPSRVVIDVPQARLGEALRGHESAAVLPANTWAVSTIAAQELDDGGLVVRVIVTLARPGRYDVKTVGNDLIVMVMPRDPAPKVVSPEALAAVQAEREQARQAAQAAERGRAQAEKSSTVAQAEAAKAKDTAAAAQAEIMKAKDTAAAAQAETMKAKDTAAAAQAEAAKAKDTAAAAQAEAARAKDVAAATQVEAERLRKTAGQQAARAAAAQQAADEARRAGTQAKAADLERAKAIAAVAQAEAAKSKADAARAQGEAERARTAADRATADALAEATRARAQAAAAQAETAKTRQDAARELEAATRTKTEAEAAKLAANREAEAAKLAAARQAAAAKQELARTKTEAEAAKQVAAREAAAAKQELARTKTDAEAAKQAASREVEAARQAATAANQDVARSKAEAENAKQDVARSKAEAENAKQDVARSKTEAETAKQDAARNRALAEATQAAAQQQLDAATRAKAEADAARREAEAAKLEAARTQAAALAAKDDVARTKAEAVAAKAEAARAQAAVLAAKDDVARTKAEAAAARSEADQASALVRASRAEAEAARADAARRTAETQAAKAEAAQKEAELLAARQKAEVAEREAAQKRAEATAAQADAAKLKDDNARMSADASRVRSEAEAARKDAEAAKGQAAQDRRKAVDAQKAEADRLRLAAAQAHDAADREEARRATFAAQRAAEEQALARIKAQKTAAELAATQPAGKPAPATASKPGVATVPSTMAVAISPAGTSAPATASKLGMTPPTTVATVASPVGPLTITTAINSGMTPATMVATSVSSSVPTASKPGVANPPTSAPVAAKPAKATPLAQVRDIAFTGDAATGRVIIALTGDATVTLGEVTQATAELLIDHAQLGPKLERKLDVSRFGGPVRAVASFRDRRTPDRVRLIAELASPATPTFEREAGVVRWSLAGADPAKRPVTTRPAVAHTQDVPSPKVGGFGAASTPVAQQSIAQLPPQGSRRRVYHGQTLDIHLKDAPIRDLLRLIADTGRVSIVVPDTIDARVTLDLTRVPWDQALEVILSSHQLWYRREGNLYRIAPRKELDAEDEAEAARREAALKAEAPRPQLVPLNYSSAADLAKKLEPMLSPHGKIAVDERTNQLIVTDVSGNREQIARLALSLDTQTPQISIEARIVEANSTFLRQIGIQWGGSALAGANRGNATGLVWPSSISVIGGNEDGQTVRTGIASPSDFAVNLPAATGSGEGGALGLSLGSVGGNFNINLRLSALEDAGSVRIISSPKVTVLNNKLASIASGVSIPISTVSATGTQTQFVQADLRLDVTPTVSQSDCAISMNLSVSKNAPDFGQLGARGDPTIQRREARTSMLVADGETSVLGGIYTRNTSLAYRKIPFLGDLPVLGWLFKNRREQDDRTELLVFITPKITNRALLRCGK